MKISVVRDEGRLGESISLLESCNIFDIYWEIHKQLGSESYKIIKKYKVLNYHPRRYASPKIDIIEEKMVTEVSSNDVAELKKYFCLDGKNGNEIQESLDQANKFVEDNVEELWFVNASKMICKDPRNITSFETFEEAAKSDCLKEFFEHYHIKEDEREDLLKKYQNKK